ncbi:MAG: hypothetical protein GEU88_08770 [Solirubrobacterales bacterium]|nr:hypothetical protein [Solirubrobacterales bacterium]
MATFLITHRHDLSLCRVAFAAWRGFESPLRSHRTLSSCIEGDHSIWWRVEASDRDAALALLPEWIAARSEVSPVQEVEIP